jgi:branched-chain amino acid transport system substrate-binding protein
VLSRWCKNGAVKLLGGTILLFSALAWLSGCSSDDGVVEDPCAEEDALAIGVLHPLTGGLATFSPPLNDSVRLAVSEINAQGGVLDRPVCLHLEDDGTDADLALMKAKKLVEQDKVSAIIGPLASGASKKVLEYTALTSIPQISCCSTSPELSGADNFFRTAPSDALQAVVLARRAKARNHQNVAVLFVTGAYGQGLNDKFKENFEDADHRIVFSRAYVEKQQSYQDLARDAAAANPDAILLVAYPEDATVIINDVKVAKNDAPTSWLFSDGIKSQDFIDNLGAAKDYVNGALGTAPSASEEATDKARADEFFAAFKSFSGKNEASVPLFTDTAYDAIYLAAAAIQAAGSTSPAAITGKVIEVSKGGTSFGPGEWTQARAAIAAGDADYHGASGTVDLDELGDPAGVYEVWAVENGMISRVGLER